MRRHLPGLAALAAALLISGCVSMSYRPQNTPFVKIVQLDGVQKFRVGDTDYTGGLAGGLDGAVRSVPEALAHAEDAESDALTGLILTLVGSVLVGLGTAGLSSEAAGSGIFGSDTGTYSAVFMVGGLATTIGAMFELSSATAHQVDAINIYNDAVWMQLMDGRPAAIPGLPPLPPLDPGAVDREP